MQFERSKDAASDLQVIGENSSDLSNWTPLITAVRVISDSGLTETLEATDDQPYDTNAIRFLRIRVIAQ